MRIRRRLAGLDPEDYVNPRLKRAIVAIRLKKQLLCKREWQDFEDHMVLSEYTWCLMEHQGVLDIARATEPSHSPVMAEARHKVWHYRVMLARRFGMGKLRAFDKNEQPKYNDVVGGQGIGLASEHVPVTDEAILMQLHLHSNIHINVDGSIFPMPPERLARFELRERVREGLIKDGNGKAMLSILFKTQAALQTFSFWPDDPKAICDLKRHLDKHGVIQETKVMALASDYFDNGFLPLCTQIWPERLDGYVQGWAASKQRLMFGYKAMRNLYLHVQNLKLNAGPPHVVTAVDLEVPLCTTHTDMWLRSIFSKYAHTHYSNRLAHIHGLVDILATPRLIREPSDIPEILVSSCFYHMIDLQRRYQSAIAGQPPYHSKGMAEWVRAYIVHKLTDDNTTTEWPDKLVPLLPVLDSVSVILQKIEQVMWTNFEDRIYAPMFSRLRLEAKMFSSSIF